MQLAEMSNQYQIKQREEGGEKDLDRGAILEKYYEARHELETITQRITSEFEDNIKSLKATKRSLEEKLAYSESEREDLHHKLTQVRKMDVSVGSEMNKLKLHLATQQSCNTELEKRQKRFDVDMNSAKDDSSSEVQARGKLAREKNAPQTEYNELKERVMALEEENQHLVQDKEHLESEVLRSLTIVSELTSLKCIKRDMEAKIEELKDELDEANMKLESLQQAMTHLKLSNQTLKQHHNKEQEGRTEQREQVKVTLNQTLSQEQEEIHEEKVVRVKEQRELEREMVVNHQSRIGDAATMMKLKRQLKKYKALLEDTQEQLEHESQMRGTSAVIRSLKNQIKELQTSETAALRSYKRLQGDTEELQIQYDKVIMAKSELVSQVNDLSRLKSELLGRVEEDQDEIEELLEKQRSHLSQTSDLQAQLLEKQLHVEDMEEAKTILESKVDCLQSKVAELENGGMNRHQFEVTEHKVKEVEQKLELERSSARRYESQISRLRNQLERLREEKSDDVSHKSTESLTRAQKQIRELRGELQDAERKEQEIVKKKRIAEARIDELESNLQSSQADLKSAQKRIEQLHGALKDHEEFSEEDDSCHMENISSDESNYSLEYNGSDLDSDELPLRTIGHTLNRKKIIKDKSSSKNDGENCGSREKMSRSASLDLMDGNDDFDFEASRTARQARLNKFDDDEDDFCATRKAREELLKKPNDDDDDNFRATQKTTKEWLNKHDNDDDDDDDDFEAKRKARKKRLEDLGSPGNTPKKGPRKASVANKVYDYDDDDDDDDDDLEQFLLKLRERMRNLDKESEEDDVKTTHHGDSNGMGNRLYCRKNSKSREPSAETAAMADEEDSSLVSCQQEETT